MHRVVGQQVVAPSRHQCPPVGTTTCMGLPVPLDRLHLHLHRRHTQLIITAILVTTVAPVVATPWVDRDLVEADIPCLLGMALSSPPIPWQVCLVTHGNSTMGPLQVL